MRCWHRVAYSARGNLSDTTGLVFPASFFYAACGREDVALFGMRAVCPKTKGPRAVGCRRTAPERMPILSGRFASGDPSSVRYSGQYEKADACRPCLACEERVVGLLAKKTFGTRTRRRTDYLVGISPCDGSFRVGPPDRFQGVVDLDPCPGRRDGPDEAFRAVCRWGRIVALWMPETLAHGFSGGKTQLFGV